SARMIIRLLETSSASMQRLGPLIAAWRKILDSRRLLGAIDAMRQYSRQAAAADGKIGVTLYHEVQVALCRWQHDLAEIMNEAWDVLEVQWRREASQLVDYERREGLAKDNADHAGVAWKQLKSLEEFVAL